MSKYVVTPAHQAIIDWLLSGRGHGIIEAVAGAGKTTTLIELLRLLPVDARIMFLAFNVRIVNELKKRVPEHVQVCTLNSLGHRALTAHLSARGVRVRSVDADKVRKLARALEEREGPSASRSFNAVPRLVRLAKSAGIVPAELAAPVAGLLPDTADSWAALIAYHDLDLGDKAEPAEVIRCARMVLAASCRDLGVIDYDDQLLLAYALGASVPQVDWLFVDEAQDLSPLQHALIRRALGPQSRLVAVGDPNQAVYGFRGADSESMATLRTSFGCQSFPLHVSYRCPRAIVAVAQRYVAHIQPHESAPEGTVDERGLPADQAGIAVGDMVVCRKTAPVVRVAYSLLRAGTPAVVLGRDIGKGLLTMVKNLEASDLDDLATRLKAWEERELAKAIKKDDEAKQASIADKADTLRVFIEMSTSLDDLRSRVETMFGDAKDPSKIVACSTIHKAKGLEAERVFVVNAHEMPSKWARQPWQQQQERNLAYVAVTRAKNHLAFVVVDEADQQRAVKPANSNGAPAPEETKMEPVLITGNTYPVKDGLKALGGRWDPEAKGWRVPAAKADEARKLVSDASVRSIKTDPFSRRRYG